MPVNQFGDTIVRVNGRWMTLQQRRNAERENPPFRPNNEYAGFRNPDTRHLMGRMSHIVYKLSNEIRQLVAAAMRASNNTARQRYFRAAHVKRVKRARLERAIRQQHEWRQRFNRPFGGQFAAPPPA